MMWCSLTTIFHFVVDSGLAWLLYHAYICNKSQNNRILFNLYLLPSAAEWYCQPHIFCNSVQKSLHFWFRRNAYSLTLFALPNTAFDLFIHYQPPNNFFLHTFPMDCPTFHWHPIPPPSCSIAALLPATCWGSQLAFLVKPLPLFQVVFCSSVHFQARPPIFILAPSKWIKICLNIPKFALFWSQAGFLCLIETNLPLELTEILTSKEGPCRTILWTT